MTCDVPVIVSQFSSLVENLEGAASLVSADDVREIAGQIERVYEDGDYVGSLVVGGPSGRPTEHDGLMDEPAGWRDEFWHRHEDNTGQDLRQARAIWRAILGRP